MKIIGIYKIQCVITNKFYVGSSNNISRRFAKHLCLLNKNIHPNRYLQSAWNKYSKSNFLFEIVEIVTDSAALLQREQFWLDKTKCFQRNVGFNLSSKASSSIGVKMSIKSRKKLSKDWIVTDPIGNYHKTTNLNLFCENKNLQPSLLVQVAKGKRFHHKGWSCRYGNESFEEWNEKYLGLKKINGNNHIWLVTNPDGEKLIINNMKLFCKNNNLNYSKMTCTSRGLQSHHKSWICKKLAKSI